MLQMIAATHESTTETWTVQQVRDAINAQLAAVPGAVLHGPPIVKHTMIYPPTGGLARFWYTVTLFVEVAEPLPTEE